MQSFFSLLIQSKYYLSITKQRILDKTAIHQRDVILERLKSIFEPQKCRIILWISRLLVFFFKHKGEHESQCDRGE